MRWQLCNDGGTGGRGSSREEEGDVAMLVEEMAQARKLAGDEAHMGEDLSLIHI